MCSTNLKTWEVRASTHNVSFVHVQFALLPIFGSKSRIWETDRVGVCTVLLYSYVESDLSILMKISYVTFKRDTLMYNY